MPLPIRFWLQEGRVRNLRASYEAWKGNHVRAMRALDYEDVLKECRLLDEDLRKTWEEAKASLNAGRFPDEVFDTLGKLLDDAFGHFSQVLAYVYKDCSEFARSTGHTIAGLDSLGQSATYWKNLHERLMQNWPWSQGPWPPIDRAMQQRARSGRDGPGENIKDILCRVQAGGPIA